MAETMLRAQFSSLGIGVDVSSAGSCEGGRLPPPEVAEVMAGRGFDVSCHRSRCLTGELVSRADLIIGMARDHVREVVLIAPSAWPRTFTLKELVRRGAEVGNRFPGQPISEWLDKLHVGRDRYDMLGSSPSDDIMDPIGGPLRAYEETADELSELVNQLVDLIWGTA